MILTVSDLPNTHSQTAKRSSRGTATKCPPLAPVPGPRVSQETRDRLYAEAKDHHLFEFMDPAKIPGYIDGLLEDYLAKQPVWYGHTGGPDGADIRHHEAQLQHKTRREKEKKGKTNARKVPGPQVPVTVPNPTPALPALTALKKGGPSTVRFRRTESTQLPIAA